MAEDPTVDDDFPEEENRRVFSRFDVEIPVRFNLKEGGVAHATANNVSLGGVSVVGLPTWQATVGDTIALMLDFKEINLTVTIESEITWRDEETNVVGISFNESEAILFGKIEFLVNSPEVLLASKY